MKTLAKLTILTIAVAGFAAYAIKLDANDKPVVNTQKPEQTKLVTTKQLEEQAATKPTDSPVANKSAPAPKVDIVKLKLDELQIKPDDFVLGDRNAKITIFEYSSLSCPHCAEFHANTLPRLMKTYIETGKVKLVHRDFPLNEPALRAAQLTRCAAVKADGDKTYYKYLKALFSAQKSWAFDKNFMKNLEGIAKLGGTPTEIFKACMEDKAIETKILESRAIASNLGINSTPSFFIGTEAVSGTKSFEVFKGMLDPLLKTKK